MSQDAQDRRRWSLFQSARPLSGTRAVRDALAGVQLAAMNIPQALGYTKIAGTPVVTGFYTLLLPPLAFAAFGSSRYLVVAADSATAAILSGGLIGMAPLGSARYVELTSLVALLTALFLLAARLLKLGFLADFLSQTVLIGFLTGVGFQVGIAVLGEMLGLEIASHRTIFQLRDVLHNLPHVHLPTVALSAVVVVGVLSLIRLFPKFPGPLVAVVCAVAASEIWNFAGHGITIIGPVTGGLPHLGLPHASSKDLQMLIGIAGSCFVMILAQSAATARFYAEHHHQSLDENADLVGLSAANAAAAFSGTFVVNGSPTQTAMVERSGGRSQLAQISTAIVVALVLLCLTKPLQYLPRCVLGAIVFIIAIKLIDLRKLASIRRESPGEFWLAATTAVVVVGVGVEPGIILAMVLSLLRIVRHSYHPHTGVLVADGDAAWRLSPPVFGAMTIPGLAIYRFGAPLFYANAGRFTHEIRAVVGSAPSPVRWLVVDAEAITNIDYTAARMLHDLHQGLSQADVTLAFARVSDYLQSDFDRHHITEVIGAEMIFAHLHDALNAFAKFDQQSGATPAAAIGPGQLPH
ncbi:MAG: SulP family inorganic anion transporter [Candidatus Korobacteraceae bacterium]